MATNSEVKEARAGESTLHRKYGAGKDEEDEVRRLLAAGADKMARDCIGHLPFHFAARYGADPGVLELLKPQDLNDATTDTSLLTALHFAAWHGRNDVVQWLIKGGASTDVQDATKGDTPLHAAAKQGHGVVLKSLIAGGANPLKTNKKGQLALGLADAVLTTKKEQFALGLADAIKELADASKQLVSAIRERDERDRIWTTHGDNGASLLHFFAGYGTVEDLKWIVALIESMNADQPNHKGGINTKDNHGKNAVHWAAMKGNKDAVQVLAEHKADLNADSSGDQHLGETPLSVAFINDHLEFAEELLKLKLPAEDWLSNISTWMQYILKKPDYQEKSKSLNELYEDHTIIPRRIDIPRGAKKPLHFEVPPLYQALYLGREDMAHFLQRHSRSDKAAVNESGEITRRTALHWATIMQEKKIVEQLCKESDVFAEALAADVEDVLGKTALQYAKEMGLREIEKQLMKRSDVVAHVEALYRDRQVYVDAANAILVGAALIAGVTFAGWLQPPLNYVIYYEYPIRPDEGAYQSFAAVKQHAGVRLFWIFNSLSFSFAIASMMACLVGVVPILRKYIAITVRHLRRCLLAGAALLGLSIVFVLGAFGAAGFAVLPSKPADFKYRANMMATTIVGGIPCAALLAWFVCRLWSIFGRQSHRALEKSRQRICPTPSNDTAQRPDESTASSTKRAVVGPVTTWYDESD